MSDGSVLPTDQARGLAALLDTLIPPSEDGRLPGAGEVGLAADLEEHAPGIAPFVEQGLAALDAKAREAGAAGFAALAPDAREALLRDHAQADPSWLPALLFHVYTGYYQQRVVVEALGLEHRPPYPEGYAMEPSDPALLDRVRALPRLYRET